MRNQKFNTIIRWTLTFVKMERRRLKQEYITDDIRYVKSKGLNDMNQFLFTDFQIKNNHLTTETTNNIHCILYIKQYHIFYILYMDYFSIVSI